MTDPVPVCPTCMQRDSMTSHCDNPACRLWRCIRCQRFGNPRLAELGRWVHSPHDPRTRKEP